MNIQAVNNKVAIEVIQRVAQDQEEFISLGRVISTGSSVADVLPGDEIFFVEAGYTVVKDLMMVDQGDVLGVLVRDE